MVIRRPKRKETRRRAGSARGRYPKSTIANRLRRNGKRAQAVGECFGSVGQRVVSEEGQRRSVWWRIIRAMSEQAGKYARFELERRFLVEHLPEGIKHEHGWRITDRYVKNTRLRLRRMEPIRGGDTIFKLGQKQVPLPPDFGRMTITNIYLSPGEYTVLAKLEALELHKRRYPFVRDHLTFSIDVFDGTLSGLVLAEIGFDTTEEMDQPLDLPSWLGREVSKDSRFTGGALASLTLDQAAELLRHTMVPQR